MKHEYILVRSANGYKFGSHGYRPFLWQHDHDPYVRVRLCCVHETGNEVVYRILQDDNNSIDRIIVDKTVLLSRDLADSSLLPCEIYDVLLGKI